MDRQSHSELVAAPVETCFDLLVDFERYPEVFGPVLEAELLGSDPVSNSWTVRFRLDMVIRTISYTLAYRGHRPTQLSWKMVEGDLTAVEGSYELKSLDDGRTEATCSQAVDTGFWMPGPIRRTIERSALADSVREMKRTAEAAA
jgi:ribosome-associated toxin RatA of RatAB toxin-antitoxin module